MQQYGPVDQLEDRYLRKVEAAGSNPARSSVIFLSSVVDTAKSHGCNRARSGSSAHFVRNRALLPPFFGSPDPRALLQILFIRLILLQSRFMLEWGSLDILGACGAPYPGSNPGSSVYAIFYTARA